MNSLLSSKCVSQKRREKYLGKQVIQQLLHAVLLSLVCPWPATCVTLIVILHMNLYQVDKSSPFCTAPSGKIVSITSCSIWFIVSGLMWLCNLGPGLRSAIKHMLETWNQHLKPYPYHDVIALSVAGDSVMLYQTLQLFSLLLWSWTVIRSPREFIVIKTKSLQPCISVRLYLQVNDYYADVLSLFHYYYGIKQKNWSATRKFKQEC